MMTKDNEGPKGDGSGVSSAGDRGAASPAPPSESGAYLRELEHSFLEAMEAREAGRLDDAFKLIKSVIRVEPRLAEPRLELAAICAERGDWDEAAEQVREAIEAIERGWRWMDNYSDDELISFASNLLGEILVRAGTEGDVSRWEDESLQAMWEEARRCFRRALEADPSNQEAIRNLAGFHEDSKAPS